MINNIILAFFKGKNIKEISMEVGVPERFVFLVLRHNLNTFGGTLTKEEIDSYKKIPS